MQPNVSNSLPARQGLAEVAVPANDAHLAQVAMTLLRVTLGALFVWVFFENLGKGLYTADGYAGLINDYIGRGNAPAAWKAVMSFMASNAAVVAPLQAATELSFGVLLLCGLLTRPVALAAFFFLAGLWVSEWGTAWIWELLVPMAVALSLAVGAAGRWWGLDQALRARLARAAEQGSRGARLGLTIT
jgi:uncharacterized membrane protein YphA (DoxX/SURF4 family)